MITNKLLLFMAGLAVLVVAVLIVSVALVFGVLAPGRTVVLSTVEAGPTVIQATSLPPSPIETEILPTEIPMPASPTPGEVSPTPTQLPVTSVLTPTPAAAYTATPQTPGGPSASCDQAQFVRDVTIPSGVKVPAGAEFTKTWQVKNTGTCTWTVDYDLVFAQGSQLGGPSTAALPAKVKPGESVNLSLTLTAPTKKGEYAGVWQLRNASGQVFGPGIQTAGSLWASIKVADYEPVFSLVDNYCDALWRNRENPLPCPRDDLARTGYVIEVAKPVLENGISENEAALVLSPQPVADGLIVGQFPAFTVKAGDRFRTVIGCMEGASGCDVTFRLSYQIAGADVVQLAEWKEKYDGKIQKLDFDLSALDGQKVALIIRVRVENNPQDAQAFLLLPRIVR